jgi:hypothetical protein
VGRRAEMMAYRCLGLELEAWRSSMAVEASLDSSDREAMVFIEWSKQYSIES